MKHITSTHLKINDIRRNEARENLGQTLCFRVFTICFNLMENNHNLSRLKNACDLKKEVAYQHKSTTNKSF